MDFILNEKSLYGQFNSVDELVRFQVALDSEVYEVPYWDDDFEQDIDKAYFWNKENVTATALAEASVRNIPLLSFYADPFLDCRIGVQRAENEYWIESIYTSQYLVKLFSKELKIDRLEFLKINYQGTRIDCSCIDEKYGPEILERNEFELLLSTLDKFVNHASWADIEQDDGLEYKKYHGKHTR